MTIKEKVKEYRTKIHSKFFLSEPQLDLACQGYTDGIKESEKIIDELNINNSLNKGQLDEAKKIIKDILNVCCSNCTNPHCVDCKHRKIVLKAEQFLKE